MLIDVSMSLTDLIINLYRTNNGNQERKKKQTLILHVKESFYRGKNTKGRSFFFFTNPISVANPFRLTHSVSRYGTTEVLGCPVEKWTVKKEAERVLIRC